MTAEKLVGLAIALIVILLIWKSQTDGEGGIHAIFYTLIAAASIAVVLSVYGTYKVYSHVARKHGKLMGVGAVGALATVGWVASQRL